VAPPSDVVVFGDILARVLGSILGDDLVGAYFVGSIALGGYVKGESDLDVLAVCRPHLDDDTKKEIAKGVLLATDRCPTRGLECTLYQLAVVSALSDQADFEINVNGGPRMARLVQTAEGQPAFWYILDRAVAHRHGIAIVGAPARATVADVPRTLLLQMMRDSMRWHREHENASLYSVLNACRAWRFADEDVLGSKLDGAAWARQRWSTPALIDGAVALRHGRRADLDAVEVDNFLSHVERELDGAVTPYRALWFRSSTPRPDTPRVRGRAATGARPPWAPAPLTHTSRTKRNHASRRTPPELKREVRRSPRRFRRSGDP
jgi:hypothetical protein